MTRPARARCSSTSGPKNSAFHCLSVTSNTACSRLDAVSSGPKMRKLSGLSRITSVSQLPEHPGGLGDRRAWRRYVDAEVAEVGQPQILEQQAAVGVRVVAHPQLALRCQRGDVRVEFAVFVEQFVGAVGRQPVGEHLQVFGGVAGAWRAEPGGRATIRWSSCRRCSPGRSSPSACGTRSSASGVVARRPPRHWP